MPQINCAHITGRLLRDPELKYGTTGKAYIKTGLAVDDGFGEKKKTYFMDVAIFGDMAERLHPELTKGVPVYVEGRLTIDEWEAKDGSGKKTRTVILAHRLDRLTWPDKDEYQAPPDVPADAMPQDDIPF